MALQNVDRKIFPKILKPTVHVPEKGLPLGLNFKNLSENYNFRGISQTPGYARLHNKPITFNETVRLGDIPDDDMTFAILPELFSEEVIDDETESSEQDSEDPDINTESVTASLPGIRIVYFCDVLFFTNDPKIIAAIEKEEKFESFCKDQERRASKNHKRTVSLCRGRRK